MRIRAAASLAALFVPLAVLAACNAIVGVEDVRLRKDAGAGDDVDVPPDEDVVIPDSGPSLGPDVLEVALGASHTCARKTDGTVKCWGDNSIGQLGVGLTDAGFYSSPQAVTMSDARHISAGKNHTCVVTDGLGVRCWGDVGSGTLGDGTTKSRSSLPVDVTGLTDAVAVAAGASFTCAVRATGQAVCWGDNLAGQLGNGTTGPSPTPSPVSGLGDAVAISAGDVHACAVTTASKVLCWGSGENGQLGAPPTALPTPTPQTVPALDDVIAVAAASRSTCALKRTGQVLCWGANELGQLGTGAANSTPNPSPTLVTGVDATAIWAGADHACALLKNGNISCWGSGARGQLGDGQPRDAGVAQPTPVTVSGFLGDGIGIATGGAHSCAPTRSGFIRCWGANEKGQLGEGSTNDEQTPISVSGYP